MAKKNIPLQPENFELETNTVWAFPIAEMGNARRKIPWKLVTVYSEKRNSALFERKRHRFRSVRRWRNYSHRGKTYE